MTPSLLGRLLLAALMPAWRQSFDAPDIFTNSPQKAN